MTGVRLLQRAPALGGGFRRGPAPMAVGAPAGLGDEPFPGRGVLLSAGHREQDLLAGGERVVDAVDDLQLAGLVAVREQMVDVPGLALADAQRAGDLGDAV